MLITAKTVRLNGKNGVSWNSFIRPLHGSCIPRRVNNRCSITRNHLLRAIESCGYFTSDRLDCNDDLLLLLVICCLLVREEYRLAEEKGRTFKQGECSDRRISLQGILGLEVDRQKQGRRHLARDPRSHPDRECQRHGIF